MNFPKINEIDLILARISKIIKRSSKFAKSFWESLLWMIVRYSGEHNVKGDQRSQTYSDSWRRKRRKVD